MLPAYGRNLLVSIVYDGAQFVSSTYLHVLLMHTYIHFALIACSVAGPGALALDRTRWTG